MNRKKRVFVISEAAYLNTGYATYGRELLKRLKDKYEVAEFSIYGEVDDERRKQIPWKNYPNMPSNPEEQKNYDSNVINQFGAWRFERAILDFKPDVVIDYRDHWMMSFVRQSPYRRLFSWLIMPTVDAISQSEEWISAFGNADGVFTYSDFAFRTLKQEAGEKLKLISTASPAASSEFSPATNKREYKQSLGINPDWKIVGTVMRNQRRKLFPDLFDAFSRYLKKSGDVNTYLYCHTSYPDNGWNLAKYLIKFGISSRVLFTYVCDCGFVTACKFGDTVQQCPSCKQFNSRTSNVAKGLSTEQLASVYKLFDLYIQPCNCLTPGQKILTENGWKNIEDLIIGEKVFTHTGKYEKILQTFNRNTESDIYKFSVHSDTETLVVTEEHPLYVISQDQNTTKCSLRESIGNNLRLDQSLPNFEFIKAKDIKVGDIIAQKIDKIEIDSNIDLSSFINDNYIILNNKFQSKKNSVSHPLIIETNKDFCKWLGLYVADGTCQLDNNKGSIKICCHKNQFNCHKVSHDFMKTIGNVSINFYKDREAINIETYNKPFANYLIENCGKLESKRFPNFCTKLSIEKQKYLLSGLFLGDGHYLSKKNTSILVTISKELYEQTKEMLLRCGLTFNVRIAQKGGNRKPQYRFEVRGNISNEEFDTKRQSTRSFYYNDYYCRVIKSIEKEKYTGKVYNIEVENDNSYTTKIGNVHNCEGFGIPCVEAAACGVPLMVTNYSATEDFVDKLNAIPIEPQALYNELETGCYRAVPNIQDMADKLDNFFSIISEEERLGKGVETRELYEKHYSWDKAAEAWSKTIDNCPQSNWSIPPNLSNIPQQVPHFNNNKEFLDWALSFINDPNLIGSYKHLSLLRDLNFSMFRNGAGGYFYSDNSAFGRENYRPLSPEMVVNIVKSRVEKDNFWEKARAGMVQLPKEKWLE